MTVNERLRSGGILVAVPVALAVLAARIAGLGTSNGPQAETAALCPVHIGAPASAGALDVARDAESPFEQFWPSSVLDVPEAGYPGGDAPANSYVYKFALDGYVFIVRNDQAMSFLWDGPAQGLTRDHIRQIYASASFDPDLYWDELIPSIPGAPHQRIVPRAFDLDSPERLGLVDEIAQLSLTQEAETIELTGLLRVGTAGEMATAVQGNGTIGYHLASEAPDPPIGSVHRVPMSWTGTSGSFLYDSPSAILDGTYPLVREVFAGVRDKSLRPRIDNSNVVRADDWVNYLRSSAVTGIINGQGLVAIAPGSRPPVPDWDVDMNGNTDIFDLGQVAGKWGLSSGCRGWIRADVNNNQQVSLGDIGGITKKWGAAGFQCFATPPPFPCPE